MRINGESVPLTEALSLRDLLLQQGWKESERIAVELNGIIVARAEWQATLCHPGDRLEVVRFVGGG